MNSINDIIKSIHTNQPNVNPTEIYNEGWMTRLLVYHSIEKKIKLKTIDFGKIKNWTSEALISSPFIHAKNNREGYTHADMALGDFTVDYEKGGKINIPQSAKTFGIIEAKMGSPLSQGTTHAPNYNQASRNVACIAENTSDTCSSFFYVVAPESQMKKVHKNGFCNEDLVQPSVIKDQIAERFDLHNSVNEANPNETSIKTRVPNCRIGTITYEEWLKKLASDELDKFYMSCKKWNKIK